MHTKANRPADRPKVKVPGVPRIYQRGNGFLIVYTDRKTGRQHQVSGFATVADAVKRDAEIQAEMLLKVHQPQQRKRFAAYAREWVEHTNGRTTKGIRPETKAEYRRDIERAIAHVGTRVLLTDINPPMLNRYAQTLADQRRADGEAEFVAATIRRILAPVKACLADAHAEGLIPANPGSAVRVPAPSNGRARRTRRRAEDMVMSQEQVQLFMASLPAPGPERRRPGGWQRLLAIVVAESGVRLSEALGLRWRDLDLRDGLLSVRQRVCYGVAGDTKSETSDRDIPIGSALRRDLAAHRLASHYSAPTDYVFPSVQGTAIHAGSIYRWSSKAFRAAGVPEGKQWHALRHTYGSRLYRQGVNIAEVSKLLGHSDVGFTYRTYIHIRQDELPTGDRLAALVGAR
jgi:integrase